jgi:hypothetical protein
MAFPLDLAIVSDRSSCLVVLDAVDRLSGDQLHTLYAASNASRRALDPQQEHFGQRVKSREFVPTGEKPGVSISPQLEEVGVIASDTKQSNEPRKEGWIASSLRSSQ